MTTVREISTQSLLAQAAYADLNIGAILDTENLIVQAGMADRQADEFSASWTVVDQYTGISGASATVFEEVDGGQRYLAIRGTELDDLSDINADGLLLIGFPRKLNPQFVGLRGAVQDWIDNGTLTADFTIAGHSLGGYLGVGLGTSFAEAGEVYTYNAPGRDQWGQTRLVVREGGIG